MSEEDRDAEGVGELTPAHPRETSVLMGHAAEERALLDAYKSGRIAHAWLLGGPGGIGKATLAYRMARYVLAHPDPLSEEVCAATSLAVRVDHPSAARMAAGSHGNLITLERESDDKGKRRTVITVEQVRDLLRFFGQTAAETGWRIAIVDRVDDLNAAGANALLKTLEEPPAKCLLLLVSDAPGRLLPTIRSRCRRLTLRPLDAASVARAAATSLGMSAPDETLIVAAAEASGSVARALALADKKRALLRERVMALLAALPAVDRVALHALGDSLDRADDEAFSTVIDAMRDWLAAHLTAQDANPARLARTGEVWEKLERVAREVQVFNLERKPMVFGMFDSLARAAQ